MVANWAKTRGYYGKMSFSEIAKLYLKEAVSYHDFYDYKTINGIKYPIKNKNNPLTHPVSTKDEGVHFINCLTDTRDLPRDELASILMNVNNWAVDNFFHELRRRISIFERPLASARGDSLFERTDSGRSYGSWKCR